MQLDAYLSRIGYTGSLAPTTETLRELHRAHLLAVPFENLDIPLGNPIVLSLPSLYAKIVERRRGGFCYELNGLFAWLLEQLGFCVTRLSARVFDGAQPGPEFDHLALLVEAEDRLLADVGFGDSFLEPLRFAAGEAVLQGGNLYRLTGEGSEQVLERQRAAADWEPRYALSLLPHELSDFAEQCRWTQTSPSSSFTQKATCSLATRDGRITLSNRRLIMTTAGTREEREVANEEEYRALLMTHFGIDLGAGARVDKLMAMSTAAAPEPG